ncbi:MAG: acetyltransferase [Mycetocola sp.]
MTRDLIIIGAGGFGRETLDVVEAMNAIDGQAKYRVVGIVDDALGEVAGARLAARGYAHIGGLDEWLVGDPTADFIIAIGSPAARASIARRVEGPNRRAATLIHPSALIGSEAQIAEGVVVCAGVNISTNVTLGRHVHLNPSAVVGHDAILSDFVSVNPAAVVSGDVVVESCVLIGAGAVVLQGLVVARGTIVGASACVTRNSAPDSVLVGVPARPLALDEASR